MRRLLIGLAAVGLLALAGGCPSPGGATTRAGAAAAQDVAEAPAPLPYVARVTGHGDGAGPGSDEPLPLVVPHWIMRGMKTALHHTLRDGAGAAGGQAAGAPTTSR